MFLKLLITCFLVARADTPQDYTAKEMGNVLELNTPYGKKTLMFDPSVSPSGDYRLEIPLDSLRPPGYKEAERKKKEEEALKKELEAKAKENEKPEEEAKLPSKVEVVVQAPPTPDKQSSPLDRKGEYVTKANHFYNQGKYYEATRVVEQLVKEYPNYLPGWTMYGSLLYVQGRKDLAQEQWKQALKLEPNNDEIKSILERYR